MYASDLYARVDFDMILEGKIVILVVDQVANVNVVTYDFSID
jgi:hypothetical protein